MQPPGEQDREAGGEQAACSLRSWNYYLEAPRVPPAPPPKSTNRPQPLQACLFTAPLALLFTANTPAWSGRGSPLQLREPESAVHSLFWRAGTDSGHAVNQAIPRETESRTLKSTSPRFGGNIRTRVSLANYINSELRLLYLPDQPTSFVLPHF